MPEKRTPAATEQFSVTLPAQALEMIEQLKEVGLYGSSRAEIARALILARLEDVIAKGIIKKK